MKAEKTDSEKPKMRRPANKVSWRRRLFGSPLTRRLVAFNLLGLIAMLGGIFYVDTFRDDLIEARIRGLQTEGAIIAGAVGQAATRPEANVVEYRAARAILRRLAVSSGTRARIFDRDGLLLADTRDDLYAGQITTYELTPPDSTLSFVRKLERFGEDMLDRLLLGGSEPPLYTERPDQEAQDYEEVVMSLQSLKAVSAVRRNSEGELIVSVAVPVMRFKVVLGSLMLSTEAGDIDELARAQAGQFLFVFLVALMVATLTSFVLARTLASPIRKLAEAAEQVRRVVGGRVAIPDFSRRGDEIGDLSQSLGSMTDALYDRIDAIEAFAADVAHEIKNPLTSMKSAVETIELAKTDEQRQRLLDVIIHDVARVDRLVSDISNASRLDAELAREEMQPVDMIKLLTTIIDIQKTVNDEDGPQIKLLDRSQTKLVAKGLESRLGQVFQNLLSNATSFSPPGGTIWVHAIKDDKIIRVIVDDEGPGIAEANLRRIFERFHSDRPETENFGNHSGLGLAISEQIVEAHQGRIWAENRMEGGARFVVELPAETT